MPSDCLVCRAATRFWFAKYDREIDRCPSCHLIQVRGGLATTDEGVSVYEAETPVFLADGNETYYYDDESNLDAGRLKVEWMREHLEAGSRVLDVGSGFGHFLRAAAGTYEASGLELAPSAVSEARGRFDVSCEVGSIYSVPPSLGAAFAAVTGWDFIEHVPDPRKALEAMRDVIAPSGLLFLSTPDARSVAARAMGRRWHYIDPVQHIVLFGRHNLGRLLEQTGYVPLEWLSLGRRYRIRYVLDRLGHLNDGALSRHGVAAVRSVSRSFLDRSVYLKLGDVLGVVARRA